MQTTSRLCATLVALAALPALAACHKKHDDASGNAAVAAGFTPPDTRPPTPLPGQVQATPITAYVGHYPNDAVDGVGFFDRTEVASALNGAVIDANVRKVIVAGGTQAPIFLSDRRVASWGCEAHNCGDHNWTLFVDPKSRKGEVCYHEAAVTGSASRWYRGGAPVTRPGDCPSDSSRGTATPSPTPTSTSVPDAAGNMAEAR